jgi:hypothetical protein
MARRVKVMKKNPPMSIPVNAIALTGSSIGAALAQTRKRKSLE